MSMPCQRRDWCSQARVGDLHGQRNGIDCRVLGGASDQQDADIGARQHAR